MRLPLSKVYRAFPELDRFSDAECRGFVEIAQRQFKAGLVGRGILGAVLVPVTGLPIIYLTARAASAAEEWTLLGVYDWYNAVFAAGVMVAGLAAAMPAYLLRDQWLRKTITVKIRQAACPQCAYSLLGLEVTDGGVVCPECGHWLQLARRGMTPEDLIAR